MQTFFCGFKQKKLIKFDLDGVDILILTCLVDFIEYNDSESIIVDNKKYYLMNPNDVLEHFLIINEETYVIESRFSKLMDLKILTFYIPEDRVINYYFCIDKNFKKLLGKERYSYLLNL